MEQNNCFICAFDCGVTSFNLINLTSEKYKTQYTSLISDLIDPEYELRVTNDDKICARCSILIEKYDELQKGAKELTSVLSRQIANTYGIGTSEQMIFMDKSKTFNELLVDTVLEAEKVKYSCKFCPNFVTECIDNVNAHILYHKLLTEDQIQKRERAKNLAPQIPNTFRSKAARRQFPQKQELVERKDVRNKSTSHRVNEDETTKIIYDTELPQISQDAASNINIQEQEFDEETLNLLIDLDLLDDPLYDSNLKSHTCMMTGCKQEFNYICDYIRHMKLKHKSTQKHIFAVIRSSIKRPEKVDRLMCPYCFTKTANSQRLEEHVKKHEISGKPNQFIDRVDEFIVNVMAAARCSTCDCEILDTTALECNHEIVRNGMAPRVNCLYCHREFYSDKLYNNHLALEHGHCFICGSTCNDREMLAAHIRSHLSHAEYSCAFCNDIYQTKSDRLEHMKLAHKEQCCMYCDEWFEETDGLKSHVRFSHADKRMQEKSCICDVCGASFKNITLYARHQKQEHKKRKLFTCTACENTFCYRYLLMDHMTNVHQRTIFDNELSFYKCFVCFQGFSSQNRKAFILHLNKHRHTSSYCSDCNVQLESVQHFEAHRERSHQDFSFIVNKKSNRLALPPTSNTKLKPLIETIQVKRNEEKVKPREQQSNDLNVDEPQFTMIDEQPEQQEIIMQAEDGSLLNMNNFILTENGELILQNLDGLLPNGHEGVDDSGGQIHIENLEQFLLEQGLAAGTEISYIQQPDNSQSNQIIIQNEDGTVSQSSQGSLIHTYSEMFETDGVIPTELIARSEAQVGTSTQNVLLNGDGDFIVQMFNNDNVGEQVEIQNSTEVDVNQSTLDELGDILLEVAAAAEKEKKPKQPINKEREALWGKRKPIQETTVSNGSSKKRIVKYNVDVSQKEKVETPASNFSEAYEFFVKGFDAKKQKNL